MTARYFKVTARCAADIDAQASWEVEGIRRAAEHYRENIQGDGTAESAGARALQRELLPALQAALYSLRDEGEKLLTTPHSGRTPEWVWPLLSIDIDKLAVIAITATLRFWIDTADQEAGPPVVNLAKNIAEVARLQVEFDRWSAEQERAAKAAKKAGEDHFNALAALKKRHPNLDTRAWRNFKRRLEDTIESPWDETVAVKFGGAIVDALVNASSGKITIEQVRSGAQTKAVLRLSDDVVMTMKDRDERRAVARPLLMPMLIPPLPWRYETK